MSESHNPNGISRLRVALLLALMAICALVLIARAVKLQIVDTEFLQAEGEARYLREVEIPTMRGRIIDRNGQPLAVSTPVESVWAHPGELLQAADRIPLLAGVLDESAEAIERRLTQRADREFVWIVRRIRPDLARQIRELDIPGVFLQREYRRFYPTAEVSAPVIGMTNIDDVGQEGLELAYDNWLTGRPGAKRVIQDRLGRIVEDVELVREPEPGRELRLTLDRRLQYLAYRELVATIEEFDARSGSVVVLDIATGGILAMANFPTFNPNARERTGTEGVRNRALTDVLEPGSVVKPFVVAAALEAGTARPDMVLDTAPGYTRISGHTIQDIRNYGELTVTEVLTKSSNVGVVQLAMAMDPRQMWSMYSRLGFGRVTGTGFPGESAGVLRDYQRWRKLEQATLAYGYGLSVTPLQLARAMAAIADDGRLRQPSFILDSDNPVQSVIDPSLAREVGRMLETVTGPGGTATRAAIDGYRVAAKTGTSRKVGVSGYTDRYVASIAGFAPVSRPRIAAVVVIQDPRGDKYYGGLVAGPMFGRVMADALRLMNVAPDDVASLMAMSGDRS
ncbi:MAG: penicillin-binding transpeptidase domain-containing protein [Wenzhouxiangellaceae bacterium]|nr:penicillin-binding transpeptidase domain-containing protein [Wenzhouxiangellaceae bacterium]